MPSAGAPRPAPPKPVLNPALKPASVRVWPRWVRWGHWALAASVLGCLLLHEGGAWHEGLGYAALALALGRVVLGAWGGVAHLRALLARREPRHLGHNPLGGWMVVALLLAAVLAGASGALYTTDRYWGDDAVYAVHRLAGWAFAVLVPLHLGGVIVTSIVQRENLVRALFSGRKRAAAPGDVGIDA
jgi:cytochrome b